MYYLQNMLTLGLRPITIKCYVANKGTETDSESYQLIGTLRETISLLKDEIRNKQVTINSLIGVIKSFTPVDTRRCFNVYKTSMRCRRRRIDVL